MKKFFFSWLVIICTFFHAFAQMNRPAQANNISTNIYENSAHAITGTALQQVMLNQNNSYVNLLSDTNLLDVRNFSPYAFYTPGMGVFYGDTLFKNITNAHGAWNPLEWTKVYGSFVMSCFIACSDTGKSVVTYHALDSALHSQCFITCSDTGKSVVTYHALDSAFAGHCYLSCSDTVTTIPTVHTVSSDIAAEAALLIPFADTGGGTTAPKIATSHAISVAAALRIPFSDTGASGVAAKIATPHSVSVATASLIPFSDTISIIATQHQVAASSGAVQVFLKTTVNLNTTADQPITLTGGTTFIITDIVMTNVSAALVNASDGEWWSGASRSGNLLAFTAGRPILLISSNAVADVSTGIIGISQPTFTSGSTLYFSMGTAEGTAATCNIFIYGYILN